MTRRASKIGCVALLLMAASAMRSVGAQSDMRVDRWGRFEVALKNARSYANPYMDVSLDAVDAFAHAILGFVCDC